MSRLRAGVGRSFGTFGELLQGVLPDGRHFLVTLPLARYSTARFLPDATGEVRVFPPHKEKALQTATALLQELGVQSGGLLSLESELPEGKGLASSSADMVATARAVANALNVRLCPHRLARLMAAIEPTDGVMFDGVVSFYHREGALRHLLGPLPGLTVVAVDEGGTVDTIAFNQQQSCPAAPNRSRYAELLALLEQAVRKQDLRTVGECATQSAILHQQVLPKAHLNWFLELRRDYGALGVVTAHSGTCLGLLLSPESHDYSRQVASLVKELSQKLPAVSVHHTHCWTEYPHPATI